MRPDIHTAWLVGDGPPILLQPLLGRTVVYGSTASLFVPASGAFPLTYQWLLNGINIPSATNAIVTINGVQFSDAARTGGLGQRGLWAVRPARRFE